MSQDTPLTANPSNVYPSASLVEAIENGALNLKSPRLPEQYYREDHSMRTKRPITHDFVESAASFLSAGICKGVGPHQSELCSSEL